jgi:MFS family permease
MTTVDHGGRRTGSGLSGGGHAAPRLERAKVATSVVFLLNGMTFATWAGRIPTIREDLDLTPGQLGFVMLVGSAGALVGLPFAGRMAARYGAARTVLVGATLSLAAFLIGGFTVGLAHSVALSLPVLFLAMLGIGLWDVAMNLEGATVERHLGRTIMPRYHAGFSLGTVLSALVAAGLTAAGVPVWLHFAVAVPVLWVGIAYAVRSFLPRTEEAEAPAAGAQDGEAARADAQAARADAQAARADGVPAPSSLGAAPAVRSAWTEPRTLLIGLVTLVAAFTEGAANDWVSVAFIDGYGLPQWAGVLGFATFLLFMTAGRWFGAPLLDRYGRVPLLRALFVAAGVGSLLVVFSGSTPLAYLGAAIWGIGVSLGFPVGMSAAADDPGRAAARMSVVSTIAYGAFLVGPPGLGWLGDHVGVLRALTVVAALLIVALLATPAMREEPPAG